jgi:molecular chaperone GrpE
MRNRTKKAQALDEMQNGQPEDEADPRAESAADLEADVAADPPKSSPEAAAEHAAEEELRQQMDSLQSEFQTVNDRYLRLAAEFQNYRRRAESEMTETWSRAQADLVRRFLDVLDDLQRVGSLAPSEDGVKVQSIVEGVDLVERKFMRALKDAGVEVVDPTGQVFNPETMEAVMRAPAASPEEDDQVGQVFQNGYLMKGHLIRPARVSVKKHD